jgi:hypothetical protein
MARVSKATFVFGIATTVALAALAGGCQNDGGSGSSSTSGGSGRIVSRNQTQDVTPGGTAVQTRTQVRETPSGERVRETQMRTREVVTPAGSGSGTGTDAAK